MDQKIDFRHKLRNLGHTLLLIGGMSMLLALCSELLFGEGIWFWVFCAVMLTMFTLPETSSHWLLRLYHARPLFPESAPQLTLLIAELSRRAALKHTPMLYWVPSPTVNAFTVGTSHNAAIGITDGILQLLSPRELAAILAHEISHIAHNDIKLMGLADVISRLTHVMSVLGFMLILLSLPLMVVGVASVSFAAILLLIIAPVLSAFLQMGLSRIREFDADREAARLTGDPEGLALALQKIEQQYARGWQRLLFPGYREPEPSLLRTHPHAAERIHRLLELRGRPQWPASSSVWKISNLEKLPDSYRATQKPKHRGLFGIWR